MAEIAQHPLAAGGFFDLDGFALPDLFADGEPVWTALHRLADLVAEAAAGAGTPSVDGAWFAGEVRLGVGVRVEPGVLVQGPALIGDGVTLRQGAYLRGNLVLGDGCTVGHCSELKSVVMLPGAAAPHFNYLGDSLVGRQVNLGAGTVLSNFKLAGDTVLVHAGGQRYDTGLRKFGAVLGDGCQTGCHAVLNPGTVAGRGCRFYPGVTAGGWFAAGSVVRSPIVWGSREQ